MSQPVEAPTTELLNKAQTHRLLSMVEALRNDPVLLKQVCELKEAITNEDLEYAAECWNGLEEWEQTAIWVAPKYGGIFTTEERRVVRAL